MRPAQYWQGLDRGLFGSKCTKLGGFHLQIYITTYRNNPHDADYRGSVASCKSLLEKPIRIMGSLEVFLPRSSTQNGEAHPHNVGYRGAVAKLHIPSY